MKLTKQALASLVTLIGIGLVLTTPSHAQITRAPFPPSARTHAYLLGAASGQDQVASAQEEDEHRRCWAKHSDLEESSSNPGAQQNSADDDDCFCRETSRKILVATAPGATLQNMNTLLSAVTMSNTTDDTEHHVIVWSIKLAGAKLTYPSLPFKLGTLPKDGFKPLNADFAGYFKPGGSYRITIRGTLRIDHRIRCFKTKIILVIPPAAPGSGTLTTTTVNPGKVSGAPYKPHPPDFGDQDNGSRYTVPVGPFVPGTPTPLGTATQKAPIGDPPAVDFLVNNSWGINQSTVAEPSGASGGGVVFVTSNWFAAYSTDGGSTFTQLNPTTIFPADIVGYCCDQIVQYVPGIDRFIWLLQGNGMRLATASPADIISSHGTAWTYWNLDPTVFGEPAGTGFDYPDLAVGDNSLYMSWDAGWPGCPAGCNSGREVVRTSLSQIQAGGTIGLGYTTPSDSGNGWGDHLSQNTGNEIFWAGHNSTSSIRIYSLMEGSNTYFWQDVGISSWSNTGLTSTTPDGQDWLNKLSGFPGNSVLGLTRTGNQVWFAWSAGTDNNFQQPHVEMLTLNIDGANPPHLSVNQQVQVWNNAYAFAYPALATNGCTNEVGMSFEFGGGGNYENHVVGFWGDFIAYITTGSDVGNTRFGDYVTIRQHPPTRDNPGNLFDAFGYGMNNVSGSGAQADPHYVLFGRPASSCQPIG